MDNRDLQKRRLEAIFRAPEFAPILKQNLKHCVNQFAELTPYISYKDIINKKIIIRGCPIGINNLNDSGQRDIIAEYNTIKEMVNDGWQLD